MRLREAIKIAKKETDSDVFKRLQAAKMCGMYGISLDCETILGHRIAKPTKVIRKNGRK